MHSLTDVWTHLPPCDAHTTRIILVRHGRSTFNDQKRYQGSSDEAALNEQGWQQAQWIGQALKSVAIDAIYTSPLQRVQQTVQGIVSELNTDSSQTPALLHANRVSSSSRTAVATLCRPKTIPLHVCEQLREIDLPGWEGRPYQEVREQDSAAYSCWVQRPHEFQMIVEHPIEHVSGTCATLSVQTTYPVLDLYHRTQTFWQNTLPQHAGQTLLIVSHGGTNHALISTALGLSPRFHHRLQQSNGGISILDYSHVAETTQLQALNLTQHLGETSPKLKAGKQGLRLLLLPVASDMSPSVEFIADYLSNIPIAYSLTQVNETAQTIAHQLLHTRPEVVQLQVQHDNFSAQWHRALEQVNRATGLTTGLAIAPIDTIQHLIAATIRLRRHVPQNLSLMPGTLSVLHYPSGDHPPILQAMNVTCK